MFWDRKNWDRIHRYYHLTYIRIPEYSAGYLFVESVNKEFVRLKNATGDMFEINLSNGYQLDYQLPTNKIYYQVGNEAMLFGRYPARQYQRGISVNNTHIHKLSSEGKLTPLPLTFELVDAIANKAPYVSLTMAQKMFNSSGTLRSIALSHRFAVTAKGRLLLDNYVIGNVSFRKNIIYVMTEYKNALLEFLFQHNDKFEVYSNANA